MDKNLETKGWFRFLKVVFILSFLVAQGIGFLIVADETSISPDKVIVCSDGKKSIPLHGIYILEAVAQRVCGDLEYNLVSRSRYSSSEQAGFYILSFIIVSIFFWLVSRTFYYVVQGKKFF